VGAGDVGIGALRTCATVFDWDEVRVWSRGRDTLDRFMESEESRHPDLTIKPSTNIEEVVPGADVVVTMTTGGDVVVRDEHVSEGMHIAALGSDLAGNQELDGAIAKRARIFVDDIRQCRTDGEINMPLANGDITEADIAGEIGEIISGKKDGRTSETEITLLDSTGMPSRIPPPCRLNISARWPPGSASKRR